jgi:hypothetical protein
MGRIAYLRHMDRASIEALQNMIEQVELLISTTTPMPENRSGRCLELLKAAKALTDDMLQKRATGIH